MSDAKRPGGAHGGGPEFDTEIDVRGISKFLVWMCIGIVISGVLMYVLYRAFQAQEVAQDRPASPLVDRSQPHLPPEPRLQDRPSLDLERYQLEQQQILTSYAWVDSQQRIVRIPVDRAIEILAARGLPWKASSVSGAPADAAAQPSLAPAPAVSADAAKGARAAHSGRPR
jgi:hypothetical protein